PCTSHFIVRRPPPSTLSPYTTLFRSRLRLDLDGLAGRHAEGGAVHQLAVDQDVAVHDGLAGLEDGAGEAGAQDERVQAHLQQLDHALAGQAGLLLGVQVGAVHLLLAEGVLRAQTLLLLEADRVVGLGAAAGTTVLARGVRALLEVLDGLRGQREPEGSGETRLAARTGDVGHEEYLLFACGESSLAAADSATDSTAVLGPGPRPTALVTGRAMWGRSRAGAGSLRARPRRLAEDAAQRLDAAAGDLLVAVGGGRVVLGAHEVIGRVLLGDHAV